MSESIKNRPYVYRHNGNCGVDDIDVNNGCMRPSNSISGNVCTTFPFSTSFANDLLIDILPLVIYATIILGYIKSLVMYVLVGMGGYQKIIKTL